MEAGDWRLIILGVYLLAMGFMDLKIKKISWRATLICVLGFVITYFMEGKLPDFTVFSGVAVGIMILGISQITDGAIGIGDGIVFMITGLVFNFFENLSLLCVSLLLGGIVAIILLCAKKVKKRDKMPFLPFVFLAFGCVIFYG